ncbi:gliding motility-associated C-terminal domain-containing protein [Fulvivirga sedimenti]|uniref:Gliding motility-associated C-terminal domain-containing protein n=1 Tax=Fulvivirga sedimenti TaxID=2879465 RepID=A0A9X1HR98_9BACT|nr:gliding motility-associated C-terminal domain-containing protein [Fulvivirga sedimenti]MCA6075533.1 gliding motility-associated C-terminal domain-containing protein [Fulvivirga sedimenti]MCA6076710.1 gliding motility-associated C-terminal domain-containing protein [Fulvivirga sedimenti]MCA6077838.1 gliding motility-associated C-terminal domain-containing protein [Fulvivirga sedimenti]
MNQTARRCVLVLLMLFAFKGSAFASHIVGGEFELLHKDGYNYQLNLILYFDLVNGSPGALDNFVTVYIYRKSDNRFMRQVLLPLSNQSNVPYSNVACSEDFLRTSRLLYTAALNLPPEDFDDPGGYYVAFERCCRNYLIDNIYSDIPGMGISAGQTFYLEFPPVAKNGQPFVNSTPRLFPPLRDYGCVDKFYYVDFSGVDDDGDSLVYSMVTPYSTFNTFDPLPDPPNPGPYPEVQWKNGFNLTNIMQGDPDLQISKKGLLTVTPKKTGLFVFAVQCEEFRDGIKIGEMRRDFQMLVVDGCVNNAPSILAREVGSQEVYREGDIIDFDYTDDDKCVEFEVRDIPVSGELVENVSIRAIPINFDANLEDIVIDFSENVPLRGANDVARFTVCFPDCPYVPNQPYEIGIIAMDDACPQPELDTVIVRLNVRPPPNNRPFFENLPAVYSIEVNEESGGSLDQLIVGGDIDLDALTMAVVPFNFRLEEYGMSFIQEKNEAGRTEVRFLWDYDCAKTSFAERSEFTIQLQLDDEDQCMISDPTRLTLRLKVNLPPNTSPEIYTNRTGRDEPEAVFRLSLGEEINFNVLGIDEDNDEVTITGRGLNFNFGDYDISFAGATGRGLDNPSAPFRMAIPCDYPLEQRDTLNMAFFIEDFDKCQVTNRDTLRVDLILEPPAATPLVLTARSLTQTQIVNARLEAEIGEEIRIRIQGIDFDNDEMHLELIQSDPRLVGRFTFESVRGRERIQSELIWLPECDVFTIGEEEDLYSFTFRLTDDNCYERGEEILTLELSIADIVSPDSEFIPPNIFTPNDDEYNQYFALDGFTDDNRPIVTGLPLDNCERKFEEVIIYNRWGESVFRSPDRYFRWYGEGVPAGIYYYVVRLTDKEFKGAVTVRY